MLFTLSENALNNITTSDQNVVYATIWGKTAFVLYPGLYCGSWQTANKQWNLLFDGGLLIASGFIVLMMALLELCIPTPTQDVQLTEARFLLWCVVRTRTHGRQRDRLRTIC